MVSVAVPRWYSFSQVSRSMVPTTVTCCYRRRCCQPFAQSQASCLSFSRTLNRHTPCPWNSVAGWMRDTQIHRSRSVASKYSRSEPSWLQSVGCDAGTCLQVTDQGHKRVEAEIDRSVVSNAAVSHWQSCRQMTQTTTLLRLSKRWTLWKWAVNY